MAKANPNEYIRVEDKSTGHKYSILERSFDEAAHKRLAEDAVDAGGNPLPAVHAVKAPAKSKSTSGN
jgi:hypothetical protein